MVFMFLIPAVTMSLQEENEVAPFNCSSLGLSQDWQVWRMRLLVLVAFALLPTVLYYFQRTPIGRASGNIDSGGTLLVLTSDCSSWPRRLWPLVFLPVRSPTTRL